MESHDHIVVSDKPATALSDRVRLQIRELIHKRILGGGHVIIEQRLAEELGVSRTPLREALQHLEGEGMVEKGSGRSFMVRKVDFHEYLQSFKVRMLLEPEAAFLAATRAPTAAIEEVKADIEALRSKPGEHTKEHWESDDRLHQLIGAHCGNAVLFATIETLRVTTRLYEIEDVRQRVERDVAQHYAIVEALAARSGLGARKAMQAHLRSLVTYSLNQMS